MKSRIGDICERITFGGAFLKTEMVVSFSSRTIREQKYPADTVIMTHHVRGHYEKQISEKVSELGL